MTGPHGCTPGSARGVSREVPHLLEQSGDIAGAIAGYRRAAALTTNLAEQRHLLRQAARLSAAATTHRAT